MRTAAIRDDDSPQLHASADAIGRYAWESGSGIELLLFVQRMGAERKRKSLFARERQLASEYDRALAAQLEYLDASAVALDAIAADVTRARRAAGEESLA